MKLLHLASLSASAALLLQRGTLVKANPMFSEHNNAAPENTDDCQEFRVTFPASAGLSFEDNSKHLVAWQAPSSFRQVNVTLVKSDQTVVDVIGVFDAQSGVTGEVPIKLNGQEPGDGYSFHLASVGGPQCETNSATFTVTRSATEDVSEATQNTVHTDSPGSSGNDDQWNSVMNSIDNYIHADDVNSKYFTNDDQRTHINEALDNELTQLKGETQHFDSKWFTNEDRRTNSSSTTTKHTNDLNGWHVDEIVPESEETWRDESANLPDHTNDGDWSAEELDPKQTDVEGVSAEEHEDDPDMPAEFITDFTNVGSWQAEEISSQEAEAVDDSHENSSSDSWVSFDSDLTQSQGETQHFDSQWFTNEDRRTNTTSTTTKHTNDLNGWHVDEIVPESEETWRDESAHEGTSSTTEHTNEVDGWHVDEIVPESEETWRDGSANEDTSSTTTEHTNEVDGWHVDEIVPESEESWRDESANLSDHTNDVDEPADSAKAGSWQVEETSSQAETVDRTHENSSSDGWVSEKQHSDSGWFTNEDASTTNTGSTTEHTNEVDGWHVDEIVPGSGESWRDESANEHTSSTTEHANELNGWHVDEIAPESGESWRDESANPSDHTNDADSTVAGSWQAEETSSQEKEVADNTHENSSVW